MHICTCSGSMSSHCFNPLCQGKHASVHTVSHQSESNYGISCKSVQSPRRPIEPIAIQHSLHPSSLLPGHHSKIPSCMKRFARNAFQWSSIIIHNGHLPLEPPIGGTSDWFIPLSPPTRELPCFAPQVWRIRRPWRDAETATIVSWTDSCKMPPGAMGPMGRWPMGLPIDDGWLVGVVGKKNHPVWFNG